MSPRELLGRLGQIYRLVLRCAGNHIEPRARASEVNFIAGSQRDASARARGNVDQGAAAEETGSVGAVIVEKTILSGSRIELDVCVRSRNGSGRGIAAFLEDDVVAADEPLLLVENVAQPADIDSRDPNVMDIATGLSS